MADIPKTHEAFLSARQLPKLPHVPRLSTDQVRRITEVVFPELDPTPCDLLFIPGTSQADWSKIAGWFLAGHAKRILACGLLGKLYYETGKPLAECARDELIRCGVDASEIILQAESRSTYEDFEFGKGVLEAEGLDPASITIACKSHHAGRCIRTLKRFFPSVRYSVLCFPGIYFEAPLTRENWWKDASGTARVYGEYTRIVTYGKAGDIALFDGDKALTIPP